MCFFEALSETAEISLTGGVGFKRDKLNFRNSMGSVKAEGRPSFPCVFLEKSMLFGKIRQYSDPSLSGDPLIAWGSWEAGMHRVDMGLAAPWEERKRKLASSYGSVGLDLYHDRHVEERKERISLYGLMDFEKLHCLKIKQPSHYHQFEELPSFFGEWFLSLIFN